MSLSQLIYISQRAPTLTADVLEQVVARSAVNNNQRQITGVLLCCGKNLMQLLEGDLTDVSSLYEKIRQDPRHTAVQCLIVKNVKRRLFPEWGMGLADLDNKSVLNRERLAQLVEDIRAQHDTSHFGVEARVLIQDFKQQLTRAA